MPVAPVCCACGVAAVLAKGYAMPDHATGLVEVPTRFEGPKKLICASCITDGVTAFAQKANLRERAEEPEPPKRA